MDYKLFCKLIRKGESETVDYKIQCDALMRGKGKDKANAELLKDIIAMANNGYSNSYIIIGVSDNRETFKSVNNKNLNDRNLQRLCRDNIIPPPKLKLHNCSWSKGAKAEHKNRTFIIIQIGPQPRQCFRFNRDLINHGEEYCHRKNEVWIRRGETSDLATPEEIKRLVEGKSPHLPAEAKNLIDYTRLPKNQVFEAVLKDFEEIVNSDKRHSVKTINSHHEVHISINRTCIELFLMVVRKIGSEYTISESLYQRRRGKHGVFIISLGNITKQAGAHFNRAIEENWGWIFAEPYSGFSKALCIALKNVSNSEILEKNWAAMADAIESKSDLKRILLDCLAKKETK